MKILFDDVKRQSNLRKHRLDLASLEIDFFDFSLILPAHSGRWKAIGIFEDDLFAVIFATLGREAISLISLRPASKKERLLYEQFTTARS